MLEKYLGWYIKHFVKEKGKRKGRIINWNINYRKHTSKKSIYLIVITKINTQMKGLGLMQ